MFGIGKKSFLGIDIGSSSIKVVELRMTGNKPYLSNYAWMKIDDFLDGSDIMSANSDTILFQALKRSIKEGGFKSKGANVAIPAFGGLITLIELPYVGDDELEQAIRFEAHKYIPTSLDEVVFSWDVVGRTNRGKKVLVRSEEGKKQEQGDEKNAEDAPSGERMQVLLVAAPKNKVSRYEQIVMKAGLKLEGVEIESFSLVRSLVGNDSGNFVIVDIGSRVCNIVLVEKGIIKVNRNIDAGGKDITKIIARSTQVDDDRAEKMKIGEKNLFNKESNLSFPILDVIFNEVNRVIDSYYGKNNKTKIDSIILSGGTANMAGLPEHFSASLGIKTVVGNPFGRIDYDKKMEAVVKKINTNFSVAVGLALRGNGN